LKDQEDEDEDEEICMEKLYVLFLMIDRYFGYLCDLVIVRVKMKNFGFFKLSEI